MEWRGVEMGREVRRISGLHGSCPPTERLGTPAVRMGRLTVVCPCAFDQVSCGRLYAAFVRALENDDRTWVGNMRVFADAGLL